MKRAARDALRAAIDFRRRMLLANDGAPRCSGCGREIGEGSDPGSAGCRACSARHSNWKRRREPARR